MCSTLSVCYEIGQGVVQDYQEAVEWYQKAAEQGYEAARIALENTNRFTRR